MFRCCQKRSKKLNVPFSRIRFTIASLKHMPSRRVSRGVIRDRRDALSDRRDAMCFIFTALARFNRRTSHLAFLVRVLVLTYLHILPFCVALSQQKWNL